MKKVKIKGKELDLQDSEYALIETLRDLTTQIRRVADNG